MRRILFVALVAVAALLVCPGGAQQLDSNTQPASHRVTWSFDPLHGGMKATPPASFVVPGRLKPESGSSASSKTYTGTIDVNFTIQLISNVPKGAVLLCGSGVGLEYEVETQSSPNFEEIMGSILESSQQVVASVSGNTATCKFTIPYSWTLPASTSSSKVKIQGIYGSAAVSEVLADNTGQMNLLYTARSTYVDLIGPTTIPADGTTTTLTAGTVL